MNPMAGQQPVPRTSARVILLDSRDRILLFSGWGSSDAQARQIAWVLPGGGAEEGEALAATAARELFEETGLRVAPAMLARPVGVGRGTWSDGATVYQAEDFVFLLRIPGWEVVTEGFTALERQQVTGHRWWSLDELRQTDALVFPRQLAPLLARLLAGETPEQPIELPW
jgi:8-oxo-dGTP pyrophosphatase MutT (NUDIX family)